MARLDLEWLAIFVEIYDTASIARAAERLDVRQAAANTALHRLRLHFNDRLFSLTSRGMMPTPRAKALYPELQKVIERLESTKTGTRDFNPYNVDREFRVSMAEVDEVVLLPKLLSHIRTHAPGVRIKIERVSLESPRRLEDGLVDLVLGLLPQLEAGFFEQTLFEQRFVCIASNRHPRIVHRLEEADFATESHVLVTASDNGPSRLNGRLEKLYGERRVCLELPSFLAAARIVASTELIATIPIKIAAMMCEHDGIKIFEAPFYLPKLAVKQYWHDRSHADSENLWLRRTIAELCLDPDDRITCPESTGRI